MAKVLILGSSGVVGSHLARELAKGYKVVKVAKSSKSADYNIDATVERELAGLLGKVKPDVVVNAIKPALSTDGMEQKMELTNQVNAELPERLARLQKKYGYKLVHLSTDWVYEGKEGVTYNEDSQTASQNHYTYTKLVAEEKVVALSSDYLILRTEGVFGLDERGSNTFMRLRAAAEKGEEFAAAEDQFSQPIYGGELARVIRMLIEKKTKDVFNVVGPDYLSRYGFAELLCRKFGWKCALKKISIKGRKILVPSHLRVDIGKVEGVVGKIQPLEEQIERLKGEIG